MKKETTRFILFVMLLTLPINHLFSQTNNDTTGSIISLSNAKKILNHHNDVRKEIGVGKIIWNKQLARYAQQWANYLADSNHCQLKHRVAPGENGKDYGENIFWGSDKSISPMEASLSWYSEKKDYKYQKVDNKNYLKTGHYTQMIWKNTKEMGVGVAVCPNGGMIVVANYYPAGNYIGEYPY